MRWRAAAIAASAVAVVAVGGWGLSTTRQVRAPERPTIRTVFSTRAGQEIRDELHHVLSFSRDGSTLVYQGMAGNGSQLWVKDRSRAESRPLAGTIGAQHPEIGPSGRWVAFIAGQQLKKLALGGGPAVVLADSVTGDVGSVAWLDDGTIVYSSTPDFLPRKIAAEGGRSEPVPVPVDSGTEGTIAYSPLTGGSFLYTVCTNFCQGRSDLWAWDEESGEAVPLIPGALAGWYVESGHLIFVRPDGSVFGVEFDPRTMELGGEPVPLFDGVQVDNGVTADMEVGVSGQLLARMGGAAGQSQRLAWISRGGEITVTDPDFSYNLQTFPGVRLSPDDRFVAFARTTDSGTDIWVKELDAGPVYRLTFDEALEYRPSWSSDGEWIMFVSERLEDRDLFRRRYNATGEVELVVDREREISQGLWSPDGEWLVFREGTGDGRDIMAWRFASDSGPSPLVASDRYDEKAPALSPDGRWIAYESDETGDEEIYVRPFPDVQTGKWQISVGGGREPVWAHSGREIFYIRGDNVLMAAAVDPGPPFRVDRRTDLFAVGEVRLSATDHASYDVASDDQRFLFTVPEAFEAGEESYWLMVENWTTELARLRGDGEVR